MCLICVFNLIMFSYITLMGGTISLFTWVIQVLFLILFIWELKKSINN